jgi:hypothetical protein
MAQFPQGGTVTKNTKRTLKIYQLVKALSYTCKDNTLLKKETEEYDERDNITSVCHFNFYEFPKETSPIPSHPCQLLI